MLDFGNKYFLVSIVEHVQIFYCFNLLQQMFLAGIVEVIFCHVSKNDKKQKESPHSFFTNVSSLFLFDTKIEHLNNLDTLDLYFF